MPRPRNTRPIRGKNNAAFQHNKAHRLEGVIKNRGIKPLRKEKKEGGK